MYSEEQKEEIFNNIFNSIENGNSLRKTLIAISLPAKTFYEWLEQDEEKSKQYARACELRADVLFEEVLEIANTTIEGKVIETDESGRTKEKVGDMLGHRRLQIDARKWMLGKLNPKKYGDKVDVTSDGEKISQVTIFQLPDNGRD